MQNDETKTKTIEDYYLKNRSRLIKKMTYRAGSVWAAEDIVHSAFERALRYQDSCDLDRFGQWFSLILNNVLRDHYNEERGYTPYTLEDNPDTNETDACPHYPKQIMREIYDLIDTKSLEQIEILRMHFKNNYRATDIAQITPHSYAKVHKTISRFRIELQTLYK